MRILFLVILIIIFPSCQFLKRSGEVVCDAHHAVAEGVDTAGSYLGGPGNLVADVLNAGLEMFCKIFKAVVSVPADIADGPGDQTEVKDEPKDEVH